MCSYLTEIGCFYLTRLDAEKFLRTPDCGYARGSFRGSPEETSTNRSASSLSLGIVGQLRVWELPEGELRAGASNGFLDGTGLQELKAIAKRVSLANQCRNLNAAQWNVELQPNHRA